MHSYTSPAPVYLLYRRGCYYSAVATACQECYVAVGNDRYKAFLRLVSHGQFGLDVFAYYKSCYLMPEPTLLRLAAIVLFDRYGLFAALDVISALLPSFTCDIIARVDRLWTYPFTYLFPMDLFTMNPEPDDDTGDDIFGIRFIMTSVHGPVMERLDGENVVVENRRVVFTSTERGGWTFTCDIVPCRMYNTVFVGDNVRCIDALTVPSNVGKLNMIMLGVWENDDWHLRHSGCDTLKDMFIIDFFV